MPAVERVLHRQEAGVAPPPLARDAEHIRKRMGDFSAFMAHWQQCFAAWFNRTSAERRHGRLWGNRFKHTILEGNEGLWTCVQYVEMNAVRASMVDEPGDYRFCKWAIRYGRGKHPYGEHLLEDLRHSLGMREKSWMIN